MPDPCGRRDCGPDHPPPMTLGGRHQQYVAQQLDYGVFVFGADRPQFEHGFAGLGHAPIPVHQLRARRVARLGRRGRRVFPARGQCTHR